jgi:serine/threonine-protein kinase
MQLLLPSRFTNVIRWGSDGSDSEQADGFLQTRVALYAQLLGGLFALLYLVGMVLVLLFVPEQWVAVHVHPAKIVNLVLAVALLGVWRVLRGRPRSGWLLRALDVGSALAVSLGSGFGVASAPKGYHLELGGLLIVVLALVVRAAIVPSSPGFTALVGVACAPPIVVAGYLYAAADTRAAGFLSPPLIAIVIFVWCLGTIAATATVSRVIYGLVAQVRMAMRLGRYTLREKIGEGGMGAVYRAEHAMLRRATAIKLLLPDRVSPAALLRFEREVQLTSQLSHPNTIAIHDYGRTPEGVFYYAMEYLEGRTLERLVKEEGPQPAGRAVHMLLQIVGSLREAHGVGLIHRDIKPGNLLVGTHGGIPDFVKVIDFGLVKQLAPDDRVAVTRSDVLAGTPLFMAPETITRPDDVDARVDIYAVGAVAYFLVTGTPPFDGNSVVEVCSHHLHTTPSSPSERLGSAVPAKLDALILRCLAKEPRQRPDDVELLRLLRECELESPWDVLALPATSSQ